MVKKMFKIMAWKILKHASELGLTDQQLEALRKRHMEAKKQMIQIGCQIKLDMIDLAGAVMREEIDLRTAEEKIREIGKLKGDRLMAMVQALQDMKDVFTPEQRRKIKEMMMHWSGKGEEEEEGEEEGEEEEEEEEESPEQ